LRSRSLATERRTTGIFQERASKCHPPTPQTWPPHSTATAYTIARGIFAAKELADIDAHLTRFIAETAPGATPPPCAGYMAEVAQLHKDTGKGVRPER